MKQVLGLIYIPVVSRSVSRVKEFRRCPEHDNLLAYEGRALSVEEFNKAAPRVMGAGATSLYGVQPIAKLVEVEVAETAPVEAPPAKPLPKAKPAPVIELPKVTLEPSGDGFVLVNYEGDEARYMGVSQAWETDVSLVIPFATEDAARAACPGVLIDAAPKVDASNTESLAGDSGASSPLVEESAPAPQEPAAQPSPPAVDPANVRNVVLAHQAAKRAAKATKNAPKKVTPPPAK